MYKIYLNTLETKQKLIEDVHKPSIHEPVTVTVSDRESMEFEEAHVNKVDWKNNKILRPWTPAWIPCLTFA